MFENKVILITGGSGSWGNELTKQLLKQYPKEIRIYSRGEFAQVTMKRKFNDDRIKFIIGDVRDKEKLMNTCKNVDYIFHLAALKHVPICEDEPEESVKTNILGVQNLIECAIANNVVKVIDVSTDKACSPFNFYGTCKAVGEKLFILANKKISATRFICVRAGNVMGSNGSIIPYFKQLIHEGKEITITDKRMTRYIMSLQEAISLLLFAAEEGYGGEIFVMKMKACSIVDLATAMLEYYKKKNKITIIGMREGEKIDEMLISEYESPFTVESDSFRIILPQTGDLKEKYKNHKKMFETVYTSNQKLLTKKEIINEIDGAGLL